MLFDEEVSAYVVMTVPKRIKGPHEPIETDGGLAKSALCLGQSATQQNSGLFDHLVGSPCVCFWTAGSI